MGVSLVFLSISSLTAVVALIGSAFLLHTYLGARIKHRSLDDLPNTFTLRSNPRPLGSTPIIERSYYDESVLSVPVSALPSVDDHTLLTAYLRTNMKTFSRLPQAWLIRFFLRCDRRTFSRDFIDALAFQEGDVVCGVYQVAHREPNRVEFKMLLDGSVSAALVITVEKPMVEKSAFRDFRTETVQWTVEGSTARIPLEMAVPKFMHEVTSWGMLLSGSNHLRQWKMRLEKGE